MKQDDNIRFTRRKLLAGLGVVGGAGALGGSGTMAMLNDDESSRGNAITAGKLDLKVEWFEWYNGEQQDCEFIGDNPGPIFELGDVKPGDHGEASIQVTVDHNPAYIWFGGKLRSNAENGLEEPERAVDDSGGDPGEGNGELADRIRATVWRDRYDRRTRNDDERLLASGSLREVLATLNDGVLLDGDPSSSDSECFEPGMQPYIGFEWELPKDVGNEVQGDSVEFDLKFHARQCRHADGSNNPFDS